MPHLVRYVLGWEVNSKAFRGRILVVALSIFLMHVPNVFIPLVFPGAKASPTTSSRCMATRASCVGAEILRPVPGMGLLVMSAEISQSSKSRVFALASRAFELLLIE